MTASGIFLSEMEKQYIYPLTVALEYGIFAVFWQFISYYREIVYYYTCYIKRKWYIIYMLLILKFVFCDLKH